MMRIRPHFGLGWVVGYAVLWCAGVGPVSVAQAAAPIEYNRDIRPILSENCFACHGFDSKHREKDLRLDTREGAIADRKGVIAIVPGNPDASEIIKRITHPDPQKRMPPASENKTLTPQQIDLLKRWIEQGAEYQPHWAFVPIKREPAPAVKDTAWPRNDIDRHVLARLEAAGLKPNPEADKATLIRRVTFDLTGLPPTPQEVAAFLADDKPDAYDRLVDRLLASPRYAEHRARFWLDYARYGDTHGVHIDNYREIWPYRDYVLAAFNENKPFDRFVVEQLAGDMLPDATTAQQVASGFNRLHITTNEGGTIPEEAYVRNVIDRVETTGNLFMGLTVGCAACHDHKYDPITQVDFYSLFAIFNSLDENPLDGNKKDHAPVIRVPTPEQNTQLAALNAQIKSLSDQLAGPMPEAQAAQLAWETQQADRITIDWTPLNVTEVHSTVGSSPRLLQDRSILVDGENPATDVQEVLFKSTGKPISALRLTVLPHDGHVGRSDNGNAVLSEIELLVPTAGKPTPVRFVAASADHSQDKYPIAQTIDGQIDDGKGWAIEGHIRKGPNAALFVLADPLNLPAGSELTVRLHFKAPFPRHVFARYQLHTTDQSDVMPLTISSWSHAFFKTAKPDEAFNKAFIKEDAAKIDTSKPPAKNVKWQRQPQWVDGAVVAFDPAPGAHYLHRTIRATAPVKLPVKLGSDDGVKLFLNGKQVHANKVSRGVAPDQDTVTLNLQPGDNHIVMKVANFDGESGFYFSAGIESATLPEPVVAALRTAPDQRKPDQQRILRDHFRRNVWPAGIQIAQDIDNTKRRLADLQEQVPTTYVSRENPKPKDAFVLRRGLYDQKAEKVQRNIPGFLGQWPADLPRDRMGFALWLTRPDHPLLARVTVNRFWHQIFGTGLVKTAEDFGLQGESPSHPQLLDHLSATFIDNKWDVKAFFRLMVTSATYRQSAKMRPDGMAVDVENRLLWRGPRYRLDAEMIRDQALAVSGLLVEQMGGPSVKPPQPEGLWEAVAYPTSNTAKFVADNTPDKVHRRSLYTFWKRTAPAPQMTTFDAPSREFCRVRRERTNTPLQALLLMNDPQFIEAARGLAQNALNAPAKDDDQRLHNMFTLVVGRAPRPAELDPLRTFLSAQRITFTTDTAKAAALISIGLAKPDPALNPSELAAWTMIANVLLNLDEVITKG